MADAGPRRSKAQVGAGQCSLHHPKASSLFFSVEHFSSLIILPFCCSSWLCVLHCINIYPANNDLLLLRGPHDTAPNRILDCLSVQHLRWSIAFYSIFVTNIALVTLTMDRPQHHSLKKTTLRSGDNNSSSTIRGSKHKTHTTGPQRAEPTSTGPIVEASPSTMSSPSPKSPVKLYGSNTARRPDESRSAPANLLSGTIVAHSSASSTSHLSGEAKSAIIAATTISE